MFIAHLPAGFLLTRRFLKTERNNVNYIKFLFVGLVASIAPDFDMAYFYLIDNRQHPHHSYWTHIPIYWIGLYALFVYPTYRFFGQLGVRLLSLFLICGLLHMMLDSIASGIKWLYPFNTDYHGIWRIPSLYDWWVANYLFHWTFLLELLIIATAAFTFLRDRRLLSDLRYQFLLWMYRLRPDVRLLRRLSKINRGSVK